MNRPFKSEDFKGRSEPAAPIPFLDEEADAPALEYARRERCLLAPSFFLEPAR